MRSSRSDTGIDLPDGSRPSTKQGNRHASTLIEYFSADGEVLFSSFAPGSPGDGNLTFFGIVFDDARIARVRITAGATPGPGAVTKGGAMLHVISGRRKMRSSKEHADKVVRYPLTFAERSADLKDMLMHDLGNSLDTLLACADSLLEEPYPCGTSTPALLQTVKSAAELMRHLLDEYYRQSGLIEESPAVPRLVTLNPILKEVGKLFEPLGANREVQIRYQLEENLPPIAADALALQRIFINLVHNAVRFTFGQGLVTLVSHYRGNHVVASVIDTGVGITANWKKARERLGLPDQRARRGIGLAVVEQLIRAIGGDFQIESNVGEGTSFHVCFPVVSGDRPSKVAA